MADSIRQRIVTNVVQTVSGTGLFRSVVDSEPFDFTTGDRPRAWVIEGNESVAYNTESKVDCDLTVLIQMAFDFASSDPQRTLYKLGRHYLARVQAAMTVDLKRGGVAFFTQEQGNGIGTVDGQPNKPIGVLTSEWVVRYHRNNRNPFEN